MAKHEITEAMLQEIERQVTENVIKKLTTQLSGDAINGGIIQNFGSTGIQDLATNCQVTIMDATTVIENQLVATTATIKGDLTVEGDLLLSGEIPTDSPFYRDMVEHAAGILKLAMNNQFFLEYADKVFEKIKSDGLDLTKIKLDGNEVIAGNKLGYFITDSNIRRLGELAELVVTGEADIGPLKVRNKRVGINTDEPAGALAVWDEECEIVVRKLRKNVAAIGSLRDQRVILSSNKKNNIVLETDGSTSIEKLNVGAIQIGSAGECPKHKADRGTVMFNECADHGQPMFWVCLGGANWTAGPLIA